MIRTMWIFAQTMLAVTPLAAVTCYGPDGHIAVEPVLHGCCSERHDAPPQRYVPAPSSRSESHEHCQDVPFDMAVKADRRGKSTHIPSLPSHGEHALSAGQTGRDSLSRRGIIHPAAPPPGHRSTDTVVLLL
ncbi:MAG: hypothetical protein IIC50_04810 [Planctomycetes bacterium]|nr:hypothetical protein [Planctomycetota bacterium]